MNLHLDILTEDAPNFYSNDLAYPVAMYLLDYMKSTTPSLTTDLFRVYAQEYKLDINWNKITTDKADQLVRLYRYRLPEFFFQCFLQKLDMIRRRFVYRNRESKQINGFIPDGADAMFKNFVNLPKLVVNQNIPDIWRPRIDGLGLTYYTPNVRTGAHMLRSYGTTKGRELYRQASIDEVTAFDESFSRIWQHYIDGANKISTKYSDQRLFDIGSYFKQMTDLIKLFINFHCNKWVNRESDYHSLYTNVLNSANNWGSGAIVANAASYSHINPNVVVCMFPGVKYSMGYNSNPNIYSDITKFLASQHIFFKQVTEAYRDEETNVDSNETCAVTN